MSTIAEQCLKSECPITMARNLSAYKGRPTQDVLRFHFEDNSCLDFQIELKPLAAGKIFNDGR